MAISNPLLYLAERSSELFFILDLTNNRFTYLNPAFMDFFNIESIDIKPNLILHMVHPEDRRYILSKLKACIESTIIADVECRVKRAENERWLRITPHLLNNNNENLLIGQAEDITTYKDNSKILHNHNNKKNSILNILAHDLAGPIGTISNVAALLAKNTSVLQDPNVERYIRLISKVTKSSIKLIQDFLNQEFLESVGVNLVITRVELVDKIKLTTADYFAMHNDLKIQFSCHSNKDSIFVEIDEDKFMQVINNLLSNALKFTPDNGSIDLYIKETKKEILISIADTGIGIPEKYHAILFEKFTKARRAGLKGEQSTGLGMSIIKTIVEWHKGKIWFESTENKGTTFFIRIPKD